MTRCELPRQAVEAEIEHYLRVAGAEQSSTVASLMRATGCSRGIVRGALERLVSSGRALVSNDACGRKRWRTP